MSKQRTISEEVMAASQRYVKGEISEEQFGLIVFSLLTGNNSLQVVEPRPDGHSETIRCPNCQAIELATVEHTAPWFSYVHTCSRCNHIIMESEWDRIDRKPACGFCGIDNGEHAINCIGEI
ncbi:MAG TPA: hypothetical protein VGB67_00220 [Fibrella sp.]|jgi:hypothetical protein